MRRSADRRVREELLAFFALRQKRGPISPYDIAAAFIEANPPLIIDLIADMVRALVRKLSQKKPPTPEEEKGKPHQMVFEELGFSDGLQERLPLEKGEVKFGRATVDKLREHLRVEKRVRHKAVDQDPELGKLQQFINEMAPYSRVHRGLEVTEFLEMKAAGIPPTPTPTARKRTRRANA